MSLKRTLCFILMISFVLSIGTAVFADSNSVSKVKDTTLTKKEIKAQDPWHKKQHKHKKHKEIFAKSIAKLVEEGKLTQEKAENISKYIEKRISESKALSEDERRPANERDRIHFMEELVSKNIITDKEAELIKAKMKDTRQQMFADKLNGLIEKGVITEADALKIKDYMINARKERHEEFEKIKGMTKEERKEYFKNHKREHKNIFKRMVDDGVITQKQAEELKKALFE